MNAYLLSLNPDANIADQWDFGFLKDFLDDNNFTIYGGNTVSSGEERAVVIVPARHNSKHIDAINKWLSHIKNVVLFLLGDEEAEFPVEQIDHPSIHIWVQNPHPGRHDQYNKLGTGYPQHMSQYLPKTIHKEEEVYFAGQVTHQRREELIKYLEPFIIQKRARVFKSKGFTQGESKEDYYKHMTKAKIAPAPSGAVIPDSFRLFEALECMAIPIADERTADGTHMEYWDWLFADITPFPKVDNWVALQTLVDEVLEDWPRNMHHQTAWWIKYKRDFKNKVLEQLHG